MQTLTFFIERATSVMSFLNEKFENIVGLNNVKLQMKQFACNCIVNEQKMLMGAHTPFKRPVFVFKGNPGTGKTVMASIVAGNLDNMKLFINLINFPLVFMSVHVS